MSSRSSENSVSPGTREHLWAAAIIVVACFILYGNALVNGFVYDDQAQVLLNPWIRDARFLPTIFSSELWAYQGAGLSNYYRPLLHVIYMLCYGLFGLKPAGYHAVGVLLHAGVCVMVYLLADRLVAPRQDDVRRYGPLAAALLFAAHPVHTDAVTPVMSVTDPALALFLLLSLYLYIKSRDRGRAFSLAAALCFFLATLCKETALLFPLVIAGYDVIVGGWDGLKRAAVRYLPFAAAVAGYFALRLNAIRAFVPVNAHPELSLAQCLANALPLFASYLGKLVVPYPLNAKYEFHPVTAFADPWLLLSLVVALFFVACFVLALRKNRLVAFALLFLVVPLLPTLYIRAIPYPFAERYLYLPSVGAALLVAVAVRRFAGNLKAVLAVAGVLFVVYGAGTVLRNGVWQDNFTLWADTVQKSPGDAVARNNLGIALKERGRLPEAIAQFQGALRLKEDAEVHRNLGSAYADAGLKQQAVAEYLRAVQLKPADAAAHNSLGALYGEMGQAEQAVGEFRRAVELDPNNAEAHYNLGMACRDKGLIEQALQEFAAALTLAPQDAGFRGALEETRGMQRR